MDYRRFIYDFLIAILHRLSFHIFPEGGYWVADAKGEARRAVADSKTGGPCLPPVSREDAP
jgi:hypothetical protein